MIVLQKLQQFGCILKLILKQYVVEDLRRHILWSGHRKLFEVAKRKGTAIVDQFDLFYQGGVLISGHILLGLFDMLESNQDILCFEVGVHNFTLSEELEGSGDLHDDSAEFMLAVLNAVVQGFVDTLEPLSQQYVTR